jgi:glucan 1,3-beta-glucosidase
VARRRRGEQRGERCAAQDLQLTSHPQWTPAFTDCAINLNGRGVGSRYDGTHPDAQGQKYGSCGPKRGPAEGWSAGYKKLLARMWSVQRDA